MFLSFNESLGYISELKIMTRRDWNKWSKLSRPKNIPSCPDKVYKSEWISWNHWLANNNYKKKNPNIFLPFLDCILHIKQFNIKNKEEWDIWSKTVRPKNIPATPNKVYKSEWISWNHWLSSNSVQNKEKLEKVFYTYKECLNIVRGLGLKSKLDWNHWYKNINIDIRIPSNPDKTYKREWVSYIDFLGIGNKIDFLSFESALKISRNSGCKSMSEWYNYSKDIKNIPRNLIAHYGDDWKGVGHWLGNDIVGTKFRKYMSFEDARSYIRGLNWKGKWISLLLEDKLPNSIPRAPHHVYKGEWISYNDFLGLMDNTSTGELDIKRYLIDNGVHFKQQMSFNECRYIRPLRFDFWLPEYNICIEYDGVQHFKPVNHFGGNNSLELYKKKDKIKDDWCDDMNIKLIRIKYTDIVSEKMNFISRLTTIK